MKKIFIIMVLMIASLLIFSACGKEKTDTKTTSQTNDEIKPVEETKEETITSTPDEEKPKHKVVLYFSDHDILSTYRIEKEIVVENEEDLAKAALEAWISGPEHEELIGLIDSRVIVEYVKAIDGIAHVSFSKEIKESNVGSSGELMLYEQISMIMQQFGFEQTQILVEGMVEESLLGHLSADKPIDASDPENYLWIEDKDPREVVVQNEAFRIYEPTPDAEVTNRIVVSGLARVYEGTVLYEFEDGHSVLDKGFTTASKAAPGWGKFEIVIEFQEVANSTGMIILYEESAEDGSRINELIIPVKVMK